MSQFSKINSIFAFFTPVNVFVLFYFFFLQVNTRQCRRKFVLRLHTSLRVIRRQLRSDRCIEIHRSFLSARRWFVPRCQYYAWHRAARIHRHFFKIRYSPVRFSSFFSFRFVFLSDILSSSSYLLSNSPDYTANFHPKIWNPRRKYYSITRIFFVSHWDSPDILWSLSLGNDVILFATKRFMNVSYVKFLNIKFILKIIANNEDY